MAGWHGLTHPTPMRAFILTLALAVPFALAGCADDATEEAYEDGAPVGDREDVIGDGEIFDEEGEPDANVLGDGFTDYDGDADGRLSEEEYDAGIGDGAFSTYDTDGDGFLNDEEYGVYESSME